MVNDVIHTVGGFGVDSSDTGTSRGRETAGMGIGERKGRERVDGQRSLDKPLGFLEWRGVYCQAGAAPPDASPST
jgi:hypothetical protein